MTDNSTLLSMSQADTTLALALVFCLFLFVVGLKQPIFMVLSGIVWIVVAMTIFITYGEVFLMIGLGVGLIGLLTGAMKLAD